MIRIELFRIASFITKSNATVNVQNNDKKSFLYAILSIQNYKNIKVNRYRVNHYTELLSTLKYKESWMPMKMVDIPKFESVNKDFGVNILTYTEKDKNTTFYKHPNVDIVYRSKNKGPQLHLILLQNGNILLISII